MGSIGCFTQADNPASAIEALISFMKSRRDAPSGHTDACRGNSRCSISIEPIGLRQLFQAPPVLRAALGARSFRAPPPVPACWDKPPRTSLVSLSIFSL